MVVVLVDVDVIAVVVLVDVDVIVVAVLVDVDIVVNSLFMRKIFIRMYFVVFYISN